MYVCVVVSKDNRLWGVYATEELARRDVCLSYQLTPGEEDASFNFRMTRVQEESR